MFSVRPLPEFTEWLEGLPDVAVQGVIAARIKRLALGLMGDAEPAGGSKRTQKTDIKRAKALAARLD